MAYIQYDVPWRMLSLGDVVSIERQKSKEVICDIIR